MYKNQLPRCPVCQNVFGPDNATRDVASDDYNLNCGRCGRYSATWDVVNNILQQLTMVDLIRLRGAIREQSELAAKNGKDALVISRDNIDAYLSAAPDLFDAPAKVRKLLSAIARNSEQLGAPRDIIL